MRVLVADDDPFARAVVCLRLRRWGFEVVAVEDGAAAASLYEDGDFGIVVIDVNMPKLGGLEVVSRIRSSNRHVRPYIIAMTADAQADDIIAALAAGADDIVTKPIVFEEFHARILAGMRAVEREHRLHERHSNLLLVNRAVEASKHALANALSNAREQATRDALTGALNRRYFDEILPAELRRSARHRTSVGLLSIDVDRFKSINDRNGHRVGDLALMALVCAAGEVLRGSDVCCRVGGDEFVVLLGDADYQSAVSAGERLQSAVSRIVIADAPHVSISISIGGAVAMPAVDTPIAHVDFEAARRQLIDAADQALYQAKSAGRGCSVIHELSMIPGSVSEGGRNPECAQEPRGDTL